MLQAVDPLILNGGIVSILSGVGSSGSPDAATAPITKLGLELLRTVIQTMETRCGSLESAVTGSGRVLLGDLAHQLAHACYRDNWRMKLGACEGIAFLLQTLPPVFAQTYPQTLLKASLFALRDHPVGEPSTLV